MTLNSTSMARPPSAANNITTGHARAGGVKHQVKPLCQPSVGVGHPSPTPACENFLYGFKAARRAARPAATARTPPLPLTLPLRRRQRRSAGAKDRSTFGPPPPRGSKGRGGFDKGTLAMAQIGLTGAGQKPARSPSQRTGHRPLSNPAAPSIGGYPTAFPQPRHFDT